MDLHDTAQASAAAAARSSTVTSFQTGTANVAQEGNSGSSGGGGGGGYSSLVRGSATDCGSTSANRNTLEEHPYESNKSHYRPIHSPVVPRRLPRQQRLGSGDSAAGGGGGGSGSRDKHPRERSHEEAKPAGSSCALEMTTTTMEMLTTATTTTPATGNSSSIASTTAASGGGGSGVPFSAGASLEEMMRSTMPVDYSNLSGVGPLLEEPRKFAHLIRNKFGSADNINQLTSTWYTGSAADSDLSGMDVGSGTEGQQTTPNASGPGSGGAGGGGQSNQHNTSISDSEGRRAAGTTPGQGHHHQHQQLQAVSSGHRHHGPGPGGKYSEHDSECSSVTSDSIPLGSDKHRLSCTQRCVNYKALNELREEYGKLKERLDRVELVQKEVTELSMALENERYRADRLEEQINDLSELHQNERENLKQAIADLEEKVQYQSDERLRDVNEILENCQTRISKMEQLSQQQYVTVEGIYNSNARAVVVKLINVVLTVLQVILLLVATVAGIIVPFLKTRLRVLTTLFCTLVLIAIVRQWPDVRDTGVHLIRILRSQVVSETST
uniref:Uncharacterized protein n=1 Tax=Anopheles melas TaxID=34690 RepID=A0A182UB37_9DIPT